MTESSVQEWLEVLWQGLHRALDDTEAEPQGVFVEKEGAVDVTLTFPSPLPHVWGPLLRAYVQEHAKAYGLRAWGVHARANCLYMRVSSAASSVSKNT